MQRIWIGGQWVEAAASATVTVFNPATLETLDTVPDCGAEDIARALVVARRAAPAWRALPPAARGERLREVARRIDACAAVLARRHAEEVGTPLAEARDALAAVAAVFDTAASHEPVHAAAHRGGRVVAVLPAPEFPLLDLAARLTEALAAGDAVVCRPAANAPLTALLLAELLEPLPPGVVGVVTGGATTAALLMEAPGVDALSGPARLARAPIEAILAPREADLELAVAGLAAHRLFNGGQRPGLCPTVYVEQPLASALIERLHEYLAFLEVGDPVKPITDLGPLVSAAAARAVEEQVARALKRGGRLVLGARRFQPWGLTGYFFQPTLFLRTTAEAEEQILGPVLALRAQADLDVALEELARSGPLHVTVIGGDPERTRGWLAAAGHGSNRPAVQAEAAECARTHPLLARFVRQIRNERAPAAVPPVEIEHLSARESWWFPYAQRRRS